MSCWCRPERFRGPRAESAGAPPAAPPTWTAACAEARRPRTPSPTRRTDREMTDTDTDSQPSAEGAAKPARTDMTVAEVRQWLRDWIANAVGQSPDSIDEVTPMVELGLASRDAVAMAADIEDRTGVTVSIAAAFEHPTIESLAIWIVEGDPEDDGSVDETDWTRSGPVERVDIAVVGLATRLPGDMNSPGETWQALLEGRDAITDLPEGRWSEFTSEPRVAELVAKARTRG